MKINSQKIKNNPIPSQLLARLTQHSISTVIEERLYLVSLFSVCQYSPSVTFFSNPAVVAHCINNKRIQMFKVSKMTFKIIVEIKINSQKNKYDPIPSQLLTCSTQHSISTVYEGCLYFVSLFSVCQYSPSIKFFLILLQQPLVSIMDRFRCSRCPNNHINQPS